MSWTRIPHLNWCPNCWFAAEIEGKQILIGFMYLCLNCGTRSIKYNDDNRSALDLKIPQHFSKEEWNKVWEKNFKAKE
jgi:hypothetical protein